MLKLERICKSFGDATILENLSLEIEKGALFGLIGPNGAGKTTLVNIILHNLEFEGEIYIEGVPNYEYLKTHRNQVVYMPENTYLYDFLTGIEFVHFILEMQRIPPAGVKEKVDLLFHLFELDNFKDHLIRDYSLGMRRTITLISTLVQSPKILILDEPVAGIDAKSIIVFKKLLKSLSKAGSTILFTTHILDVLENLCDYIAILHHRKIAFHGRTSTMGKNEIENIYLNMIGGEIDSSVKRFEALLK